MGGGRAELFHGARGCGYLQVVRPHFLCDFSPFARAKCIQLLKRFSEGRQQRGLRALRRSGLTRVREHAGNPQRGIQIRFRLQPTRFRFLTKNAQVLRQEFAVQRGSSVSVPGGLGQRHTNFDMAAPDVALDQRRIALSNGSAVEAAWMCRSSAR